jgi:DNA-binding response OmpR family regulator
MGKIKILLVEDDATIAHLITDYMGQHGFDVVSFTDGPEALDHVQARGLPHLALLDLGLPTMHGFDVAAKLKSMADVPIIFITANSDKETLITGLKKYGEDFITKPFDVRELEARVQVILARMPSLDYASEPIIRVDGKTMPLTPTESILLHVLLRNAARVVENRTLIARVWPSEEVYEDTLRVHMHRLRRKLEVDSHHPMYIRTERGVGYVFTVRPQDGVEDEE